MSVDVLSALSSGLKIDLKAEKDAQQKRAEEAGVDTFASLLAQQAGTQQGGAQQAGPASNVTTISGQRGTAVIPAALIDIAADIGGDVQTGELDGSTVPVKDPTETFLEFASKSPAEKMRAMVLGEMGLTEEDLRNLSAEDRAALEAKIQIRIEAKVKQEIDKKSGFGLSQSLTAL
jgi:hypothetical protein